MKYIKITRIPRYYRFGLYLNFIVETSSTERKKLKTDLCIISELKGGIKSKEGIGSDSGYEENGSNSSKSHILNIKLISANDLKGLAY